MPSIEALMNMLATMVLFIVLASVLLMAYGTIRDNEISFGHAYPMTQKIAHTINSLSAGPQNESVVLKITALNYRIDFDLENNYVESEVEFLGNAKYGLFLFPNIELVAEDIDCISDSSLCLGPKNLLLQKEVLDDNHVKITITEVSETEPGPGEECSDQSTPGRPCGCYSTDFCNNVLINGECLLEQYECDPLPFECCCCHDEVP